MWGTGVFTGSNRGNATHCVIAPCAWAHHLPAIKLTWKKKKQSCQDSKIENKIAVQSSILLPLFNDEGLPVLNNASGIPTVFWLSLLFVTCLRFLPLLLSWWAVKARATLPSAVANSTFFKLGLSFSWENIDCRQEKSTCWITLSSSYSHSTFTKRFTTGVTKCTFHTENKSNILLNSVFTCPKVEYRNTGISATVMAKAWMMGIPSACFNDISEMKLPKGEGSAKLKSR